MAEGGNVPQLGGYDYEFTSRVPDDWECLVCHLTMKDPVQILGCGHRLCNICMASLLRRPSPKCPADRQPLSREKIFPDAACHRKILDLTVKCSHLGCSWTGELRAVEKHQSECPFKVVKCPNSGCTMKLTLRDLHVHMAFECFWRKINCDYCQDSFIVNQKQEHFGVCRKFPVQCTNNCGLRDIPREKLEAHVRDECPATKVHCEYKNLGCKAVFPRSNAKSHSQTQVECHLNLALRGLEATQLQVHELFSLVKDQSQQMEQMKAKLQEQSQQIERHEQIIEICSPSFEWKIPNFQVIWERASTAGKQTRSSEMFYLFKSGYRYSLKMIVTSSQFNIGNKWYLSWLPKNGLSLCIKVVPGEFDQLLSWPCKEKVRVTLIDQKPCQNNRVNISGVVDFEKGREPCSKPDRENTHDFRFALYLNEDSLQTRSYIKNDTIFIMAHKE